VVRVRVEAKKWLPLIFERRHPVTPSHVAPGAVFRRGDRGKFPAPLPDGNLRQGRFDCLDFRRCGPPLVKTNEQRLSPEVRSDSVSFLAHGLEHGSLSRRRNATANAVIATRAIVIRDWRVSVRGANLGLAFIKVINMLMKYFPGNPSAADLQVARPSRVMVRFRLCRILEMLSQRAT
jgi:hypothetical protein